MSLESFTSNHSFKYSPLDLSQSAAGRKPRFVIKKHDTKQLHHDFHLEIDGMLKSWALPNGISTNPGENRLAVATDDCPLQHAEFEGTIPSHEYGAGTVMVWDTGTFDNLMVKDGSPIPMHKCYENGQIEIRLHGKRVSGGFILVECEGDVDQDKGNWLLIKMDDDKAGAHLSPVTAEDKSILTGRTLNQIEREAQKGE